MQEAEIDPFGALVGLRTNGCWLGHGAALFLEFGELRITGDLGTRGRGEWSAMGERFHWRIEEGDRVLAGSESQRAEMEAAVNRLDGLVFLSGKICDSTGDSVLKFSDEVVLRTFVWTSEEDARWALRKRGAKYECVGHDTARR